MEPTIHHGSYPITGAFRISRGAKGVLDAGTIEIIVESESIDAQLQAAGYEEGKKCPEGHAMWVERIDEDPESDLLTTCRVSCIGLHRNDEKRQRRIRAFGRVVSIGPIEKVILVVSDDEQATDPNDGGASITPRRRIPLVDDSTGEVEYKTITTPTGTAERWNINEPIIQLEDRYFTTAKPSSAVNGTSFTPDNAPTPPSYQWGSYSEPMRLNHPSGWVLDSREINELFRINDTLGLWEVVDSVSYYQVGQPD